MIFPEGTRIRHGSLARPKRGRRPAGAGERRAGRAGRGDGQPSAPGAAGSSARCKVHVRCGAPAHLPARARSPRRPGARGDGADLAVRRAPVGVARRPAAAAHRRRRRSRLDGHRAGRRARARRASRSSSAAAPLAQAERLAAERENSDHLPGVALPDGITVTTVSRIEFAGRGPRRVRRALLRACPPRSGEVGASIGERIRGAGVLQGARAPARHAPVAPTSPSAPALARVAALAGPAHAARGRRAGASVVVASRDADLRRQLVRAVREGGRRRRGDRRRDGRRARGVRARTPPRWPPRPPAAPAHQRRRRGRGPRLRRGARAGAGTRARAARPSPAWPARATWWRRVHGRGQPQPPRRRACSRPSRAPRCRCSGWPLERDAGSPRR